MQTLAEHSFNVAQIAVFLGKRFGMPHDWDGKVALEAIDHDIEEVLTGDAPTPSKKVDPERYKGKLTPKLIVKMADIIEAYTFIVDNKMDRHGDEVETYVWGRVQTMLDHRPLWEQEIIQGVIGDITRGKYRI